MNKVSTRLRTCITNNLQPYAPIYFWRNPIPRDKLCLHMFLLQKTPIGFRRNLSENVLKCFPLYMAFENSHSIRSLSECISCWKILG